MQNKLVYRGRVIALMLAMLLCITQAASAEASSRPATPTFQITKRTKTSATIKIKKKGSVTAYRIYVKAGKKGQYKLSFAMTRTVKIEKLKKNQTYFVKVMACRGLSKSKMSVVKKIPPYEDNKTDTETTDDMQLPDDTQVQEPDGSETDDSQVSSGEEFDSVNEETDHTDGNQ